MLFDVSASTRNFLVNDINSLVLIAPLWIRGLANPLRNSVLYYRVAMDPTTLAEVEAMIVDFNPDLTDFHPKLAFVSTWLFKNDDLVSEGYIIVRKPVFNLLIDIIVQEILYNGLSVVDYPQTPCVALLQMKSCL